jgi:nitroreductase
VKILSKPGVRLFYGAPVLVLVLAAPGVVEEYDCALAAENMMLAAHSLEIGSCWVGLAKHLGEDVEFLREVGVPEGHKLIAPIIFGYPAKSRIKVPARNADVIINWMG